MKKLVNRNGPTKTHRPERGIDKGLLATAVLIGARILGPLGRPMLERPRKRAKAPERDCEMVVDSVTVASDTSQLCVDFADGSSLLFPRKFGVDTHADHVAYGVMVGLLLGREFRAEYHRQPGLRDLYLRRVSDDDNAPLLVHDPIDQIHSTARAK